MEGNGMEMGWRIGAVLLMLAGFGCGYNWLVARLERSTYGKWINTALLVMIGTAVTLAGAAVLIGINDTLLVFGCFAASGLPMFGGSYIRQVQMHHQDEQRVRKISEELVHDKAESRRV